MRKDWFQIIVILQLRKMKMNEKILIKDPYLNSTFKSDISNHYSHIQNSRIPNNKYTNHNQKWKIDQDIRRQLQNTQNQFRRITRAYTEENILNKKILDYQAANNEYHEALKIRNLDLNNQVIDLATQKQLLANRYQGDNIRTFHQKDALLRKFQAQAEQLLQARKTINNLLELKSRLQQEMQRLTFLLQSQSDRFALEMRQNLIRMQGLQRTIKNITETKDQQISQLRHRIRIYQDENKRLNDENRTLHITHPSNRQKQNRPGIQNLSHIQYMDSQTKDLDGRTVNKQLQQQKNINDKLQRQIEDLKRRLFPNQKNQNNYQSKKEELNTHNNANNPYNTNNGSDAKNRHQSPDKTEINKAQGIINSVNTIRNGINKEVFDVFYKSVKDGEKHRSNSLVIFIQNWKYLDLQRMQPYIQSYFETRSSLKDICLSQKYKGRPIHQKMQQTIPLHIALKKGRSEINTWILSTIQLTKNQRESSKQSMNNLLLFLFRLLTIQYRIYYPMQGKSYTIDRDVQNQLSHEIVKAINYILQFR